MTNDYNPPWSARSTFLGRLAQNALLDNLPPARPTMLGGLALSARSNLEPPPPPPPVSLASILAANRLLAPPVNQGDVYLRNILRRETVDTSANSPLRKVQTTLWPVIWNWANGHLLGVEPSGSFAKGTANVTATNHSRKTPW